MKPDKRIAAVVLLVAAGAAYAIFGRGGSDTGELTLYGNVDIREVELAFRQPGRVASVAVDEGITVAAGDVLAELDAQPYRDALAIAAADVARAQAELDKLRSGNRPQDVRRAAEAVRQAEAAYDKADADLRRQTELSVIGAASQKVLEAARAARDQTAAALVAARQELSLQQEGARTEDIAAAEARLAAATAARAQAQTALEDTRLVAPSGGTVLARVREPGSMVGTRDPVLTLSLVDPVYVRAYVSEPDLGRIAPGTAVRISTDSSPEVYEGHIGFISPRAEFTPKSVETTDLRTDLVYRLRIVVDGDGAGLRQGMPVTVRVDAADSSAG